MITYPFGQANPPGKRRLVMTVTYGSLYEEVAVMTHPAISNYAKRHQADFLVIDGNRRMFPSLHPSFEDWQSCQLLETYDEIVHIDTDTVITKDALWLLTLSAGKFAAFDEIRRNPRRSSWEDWPASTYFNLGVWGCTKKHAKLWSSFQPSDEVDGHQDYLNLRIKELGIPVYDIGPEYNKMCYDWHGDYSTYDYRQTANIIHYAGVRNPEELLNRVDSDLKALRRLGRSIV